MVAYNTQQNPIILKEYGRNVQNIAKQILSLDDQEKKKKMALAMIELMKQINPGIKDNQDYQLKVWNDLNIVTNFDLNVDHPEFSTPEKHDLQSTPNHVAYPGGRIRYKHYGKNIELLIKEAVAIEDEKNKQDATVYIARMMKRYFQSWNKDYVEDEVIIEQVSILSKGELTLDPDMVKEKRLLHTQNQSDNRSNYRRRSNNNNRRKRKK